MRFRRRDFGLCIHGNATLMRRRNSFHLNKLVQIYWRLRPVPGNSSQTRRRASTTTRNSKLNQNHHLRHLQMQNRQQHRSYFQNCDGQMLDGFIIGARSSMTSREGKSMLGSLSGSFVRRSSIQLIGRTCLRALLNRIPAMRIGVEVCLIGRNGNRRMVSHLHCCGLSDA